MNGFLVIDKPAGLTSHDVVSKVRRILNIKKVGHTGTLDPFATGVLPVAVGEATKAIPYLDESVKEYLAVMRLGITTDTQDRTGKVLQEKSWDYVTEEILKEAFGKISGSIKQIPPMFSALKRHGIPLYKLAREGKTIEREARDIHIHSLNMESMDLPCITFRVRCSRGTYVRTLADDLGSILGCGAHLCELRRISSGIFNVKDSIELQFLTFMRDNGHLDDKMVSINRALTHLKNISLTEEAARKVMNGVVPRNLEAFGFDTSISETGEKFLFSTGVIPLAIAGSATSPSSMGNAVLKILRVFNLPGINSISGSPQVGKAASGAGA